LDNNVAPYVESILDESGSHFSNLWKVWWDRWSHCKTCIILL